MPCLVLLTVSFFCVVTPLFHTSYSSDAHHQGMNMFFMSFMDLIERFRMLLVEFGGYVGVKVEE